MSSLFQNIIEGATAGALIGAACDSLGVVGTVLVAGPENFAAKAEKKVSKAAVGTLIGAGAGVVKTIVEESED